jgi:hypothetical protein
MKQAGFKAKEREAKRKKGIWLSAWIGNENPVSSRDLDWQ